MKRKALISVIIPVYNGERYISKCIESIINQSYTNIEILLINDGSSDQSSVICETYAKAYNNIRVIHKKNGGVSTARNIGIEESKGDYISFVDSDDWLEPTCMEILINCIMKNDVEAVLFEYFVDHENGCAFHKTHSDLHGFMDAEKAIQTTISPVNRFVWSKIFSKKIIEDIKFDTTIHFGEDTLFSVFVLDKAKKVFYLNKPMYHYYQSENSATRLAFNPRVFTGVNAYRQLVELCKLKYPAIIDTAQEAYKNIIINTLLNLLENPDYLEYEKMKKSLLNKLRDKLIRLFLFSNVSWRLKFKFAIAALNPSLLLTSRKIKYFFKK